MPAFKQSGELDGRIIYALAKRTLNYIHAVEKQKAKKVYIYCRQQTRSRMSGRSSIPPPPPMPSPFLGQQFSRKFSAHHLNLPSWPLCLYISLLSGGGLSRAPPGRVATSTSPTCPYVSLSVGAFTLRLLISRLCPPPSLHFPFFAGEHRGALEVKRILPVKLTGIEVGASRIQSYIVR